MVNIIIRFLWALFIGSWLTPIWYFFGFIFTALIFTAPIGLWFFDRIGYVYSLYEDPEKEKLTFSKAAKNLLWFYFIGWWAGFLAIGLAEIFIGLIITFPLGWAIINRLDKIVVLS
ncbi:MAG: hypothetical protein JXA54_15300 [Candidatus Heimdallarchaeota archaeon]|nr:hypothetical protein [Candidatus Heimdallarchaeota archaeon]